MDDLHLQLLSDMAAWARRHGERVALDSSVVLALLDEIYTLRQERDEAVKRAEEVQVTLDEIPAVAPPELQRVIVSSPEPTDAVCTCGKTFMNARALSVHVRRSKEHAWEREQQKRLAENEDIPNDEPLVCPECGKDTFGSAKGLAAHLRLVHDLPNSKSPVCPICGADGFKDARGLGGHIWGKHHIRASEMKAP